MARHKESLESLLDKALAQDDDWVNIKAFCQQVAEDKDSCVDFTAVFHQ